MNFVGMLIIAWILTLFDFDNIFINGAKEIFKIDVTSNGYYFVFFLIGLIIDFFEIAKNIKS